MRCDKCKYWEQNDNIPSFQNIGECSLPKPWWNRTDYSERDGYWGRELKEEYKDDLMWVQDGSDYTAHLYTKANFFCAAYIRINYGR